MQTKKINDQYGSAVLSLRNGLLSDAEVKLRKLLKASPKHIASVNLLSIVCAQLGKFEEALVLNKRAINVNPSNAEFYYNRGVIFYNLSRREEAAESFERAISVSNGHAPAYHYLGMIYNDKNDMVNSLFFYGKALEIDSNIAEAHFNSGIILSKLERNDEAIKAYENAISINNQYVDAYYNLGNCYNKINDIQKALYFFQKAVGINENFVEAHFNSGINFSKLNKNEEAIKSFEKTIAIDDQHSEAFYNLGNCYSKIDVQKSLYYYQKALNIDGNLAEAYLNIGLILSKLNRNDDAIIAYENAVAINNKYSDAFQNLGDCYYKKGLPEKAVSMYRKTFELDPENVSVKFMLSALTGETLTDAPEKYVADLFDHYAEDFEKHLTAVLEYKMPKLLRQEFDLIRKDEKKFDNAIDLGCGTGLCGLEFRDLACRLSGIDLSSKILEKAQSKKIYDDLKVCNIKDILEWDERYDLVIASDVFVYFGNLNETFDTISKKTTSDAFFIFSVETTEVKPFELQKTGRFAHSHEYIAELASQHNFVVKHNKLVQLRKEKSDWLYGEIFILQKIE